MGAYDNMFSNASTFKVELDEWCVTLIIKNWSAMNTVFSAVKFCETRPQNPLLSLMVRLWVDVMSRNFNFVIELGRGTSTFDGMAIASVSHV